MKYLIAIVSGKEKYFALISFILITTVAFSQIDKLNQSVRAVTNFVKNDTSNYLVKAHKVSTYKGDTTYNFYAQYKMRIVVQDSNASSFTLDFYFDSTETSNNNSVDGKNIQFLQDLNIRVKTTERGSFVSFFNWREILDLKAEQLNKINGELAKGSIDEGLYIKTIGLFGSRDGMEHLAFPEVNQFLKFYGKEYKLNKKVKSKAENWCVVSGSVTECETFVKLDEIKDDIYYINQAELFNKNQLREAVINAYKTIGLPLPEPSTLESIGAENIIVSAIHDSGWLVFSSGIYSHTIFGVESNDLITIELQ